MSETVIQQLIAYPSQAPSSNELWLANPQRLYELTREEAEYLAQTLTELMDDIAAIMVEEAGGSISPKYLKEHLIHPFIYTFNKGVEIIYKLRIDSEEPVEFNADDIDGAAGNQIPEHLQLKVTSAIPIVAMVFEETIDFADQEATSVLDIEELFKSILTGGMFLGVEFCLRQKVQNDLELM